MTQEYILITHGRPKPKEAAPARKARNPRKSRRETGDVIEIVETGRPRRNNKANSRSVAAPSEPPVSAVSRLETAPGLKTANDIDYGDTLRACSTVDEVRGWFVRQQTSFNDKVARAFS